MSGTEKFHRVDVRQLIKVSKPSVKRINHPHAHYNQLGKISCIICGIQVKSELVWSAHILSKTHKQNELRNTQISKRSIGSDQLLNSQRDSGTASVGSELLPHKSDIVEISPKNVIEKDAEAKTSEKGLPTDFFDPKPGEKNPAEIIHESSNESQLPEGFFDDRYKDAKARNVPYRDKLDEEMELFQKELVALDKKAEQIIEEESEAMVSKRDLDEVEQQITKWRRINVLELQKAEIESKMKVKLSSTTTRSELMEDVKKESTDSDTDDDLMDDFDDFRTKLPFSNK